MIETSFGPFPLIHGKLNRLWQSKMVEKKDAINLLRCRRLALRSRVPAYYFF